MASQITENSSGVDVKENTKARDTGPLTGESTCDRWIPLTKGQQHEKRFHVMTSYWDIQHNNVRLNVWYFLDDVFTLFVSYGPVDIASALVQLMA